MHTETSPTKRATLRVAIVVAMALALLLGAATAAHAVTFDPELIISNDNMRAAKSMSKAQIQAFLETQPGVLKDLVAKDYLGVRRPASEIIWNACQDWQISPKVMLTMLQKEQSLLTRTTLAEHTLERAVGAGCPDANTNRYPGFGNQIWNGARLLDSYGETHPTYDTYYVGISKKIYQDDHYGSHIHPKNMATFKLYVYNPSIGAKYPYGDLSSQASKCSGNANFWLIYRRYFGSTFANPRIRPIYRFRNRSNGTYLYTASIAERYKLKDSSRKWDYGGISFSWDTSVPVSATKPVWRFYNRRTHKYSFTADPKKYRYRRSATGDDVWKYGGIAWRVSTPSKLTPGAQTIYRFKNRSTGGMLLTSSTKLVSKLRSARYARKWRYLGPGYYLPRYGVK